MVIFSHNQDEYLSAHSTTSQIVSLKFGISSEARQVSLVGVKYDLVGGLPITLCFLLLSQFINVDY